MRIGRKSSKILNKKNKSREFDLLKEDPGARVDGIYIPGAAIRTTLIGSIQPATDSQRLMLPEGERLDEAIAIYYETLNKDDIRPLRVGSDQTDSDKIDVDSLIWAVRAVKDYHDFGHLEIIATRLEAQDG